MQKGSCNFEQVPGNFASSVNQGQTRLSGQVCNIEGRGKLPAGEGIQKG